MSDKINNDNSEEIISKLTNLCNDIRQEYQMEYNFNEEEKKYIIENKFFLLTLGNDTTKSYKIYYEEFVNNICDIIQEKINKNIDIRIRKHLFIQIVSRDNIETSSTIEKEFYNYFNKYNIQLKEPEKKNLSCKMITCKGGIYIRETIELDSPIVKYCMIAKNGILQYKTKFFSDYQVVLPIYVNGEEKKVVRLHVVNEEGDELGWTSATNMKGELLCKDVPSHKTTTFKFIYADNHIPDEINYDEFIDNIASELGLTSLREDILHRGFIDLSHCNSIVSTQKIIRTFERIVEDEKNRKKIMEIQKQEEKETERKELIKTIGSSVVVSLLVGGMYRYNKSKGGQFAKTSFSRKAVSSGLKHLAQANTGAKSVVIEEIASYLEKNEEKDLNIFSMDGLAGQVFFNCVQKLGVGNIPEEMSNFTQHTEENNKEEPDVKNDSGEEQHMNEVDNLLNIFKEKEKEENNINMDINDK